MAPPGPGARILRFDDFELDTHAGELRKRGVRLRLQGQPLQVLAALLNRAGDVVTREQLRAQIWTADTFVDFDHSLHNAIARLREVLGDSAETPRYIETLPRRGYRFVGRMDGVNGQSQPRAAAESEQLSEAPVDRRPTKSRAFLVGLRARHWLALASIVALGLIAIAYVMGRSRTEHAARPSTPKIQSLAVLPLRNLSGDSSQEYLADGMTDALIGRLSQIHDLRVTSHTSVMRFKNPQTSVPDIASTLHVDAIVEGSVMREGNQIRVTAQLIRGATDEHFWSETYDRELQDVLALESDVAQAIAEKVEVTVTGEEHARLVAARPVRPEVYESYLQGSYELNKTPTRAVIEQAIADFNDAIRRDPTFAPAYLGLTEAYSELGSNFIGEPPEVERQKEIGAARKAVELDPTLASAHALLASALQEEWRWSEAELEYKSALELNPNDALSYSGYGWWLLCQGRADEALQWLRRARELDPFEISGTQVAQMLTGARRYDEAIHELRTVLATQPNDPLALWNLGIVLIYKNQPEEAIPVLEEGVVASNRSPGVIGSLIRAYAVAGRRSDAMRLLSELQTRRKAGFVPARAFVDAYIGLGDKEQAFAWLEQGYKDGSNILQWLKVTPELDSLRSDPRFANLLRRVGLN